MCSSKLARCDDGAVRRAFDELIEALMAALVRRVTLPLVRALKVCVA
jgi:hypothetical protein